MPNCGASFMSDKISPMHILIVEDDPAIAITLRFALEREGYSVAWADMVTKVPLYLDVPQLDAIVLDVGLPDGNGFEVCQSVRRGGRHAHVPIVFLTARSDEVDRILGLEMGADDYIAKPFSPRELIARLKAIWRRQSVFATAKESVMTDFEKNVAGQAWRYQSCDYTLYLNNHALFLSKMELAIMLTLLANPARILTREQILAKVSNHPEHRLLRTVDAHIKGLRQKLSSVCHYELIITHRGLGYGMAT